MSVVPRLGDPRKIVGFDAISLSDSRLESRITGIRIFVTQVKESLLLHFFYCLLPQSNCSRAQFFRSTVYIHLASLSLSFPTIFSCSLYTKNFNMANSQSANELSQKMDKLSINGKRHVDAPRYTPPHRKYAQANKTVETSTTAPANNTSKPSTPAPSVTEKSVPSKLITPAGSEATEDSKITPTTTPVSATTKDSEPKPKPAARSIAPHHKYNKPTTKVADSWEEEEEASSEPQPSNSTNSTSKQPSDTAPVPKSSYIPPHLKYRSAAPSPPSRSTTPPSRSTTPSASTTASSTTSERRPEKTNAVAHRLIAGALGVKVPRRTEEQRAYDKAMREQEKRKRDQEREAKKKAEEDAAKAKAAIWDD
jgi:hypothetical protein